MKTAITWPRIILPPLKRKGHVVLDVCASSGTPFSISPCAVHSTMTGLTCAGGDRPH